MADPDTRIRELLLRSSNRQGGPYSDYASLEERNPLSPRFERREATERVGDDRVSGVRAHSDRTYRETVDSLRRNGVSPTQVPSLTPTRTQVEGFREHVERPETPWEGYEPPPPPTLSESEMFTSKQLMENFVTAVNTIGATVLEGANAYDRYIRGIEEQPRVTEFGGRLMPGQSHTFGRSGEAEGPRGVPIRGSTGDFIEGGTPFAPEYDISKWQDYFPQGGGRYMSSEYRSTEPGEALRDLLDRPLESRPWADFLGRVDLSNVNREMATWILEFTEPDPTNVITPFAAALIRFGDNFKFTKMLDDVLTNGGQQAYDDALEALHRRFDNMANMNFNDPAFGSPAAHDAALKQAEEDFLNILEANGVPPAEADHALLTFGNEWESANAATRSHFARDNVSDALEPYELSELERYTTADYRTVNDWLRGSLVPNRNTQRELERRVAALDAAFENPVARLPEDLVIYRGTTTRSHRLVPEIPGVEPKDITRADLVGRTLPGDAAIQSWAEGAEVGYDFMRTKDWNEFDPDEQVFVLYQMEAPAGTPALSTASAGTIYEEAEIVLPRGTQYHITDAEWRTGNPAHPGHWFLTVEPIIPDQPPPTPAFGANAPAGSAAASNPNFVNQGIADYSDWVDNLPSGTIPNPYTDPGSLQPDELIANTFSLMQANSPLSKELSFTDREWMMGQVDQILDDIQNGMADLDDIHIDISDLTISVGEELSSEAAEANLAHVQAQLYALANQSFTGYNAPSNLNDILAKGNPYVIDPNNPVLPNFTSAIDNAGAVATPDAPAWIQPGASTNSTDWWVSTYQTSINAPTSQSYASDYLKFKGGFDLSTPAYQIPLDTRLDTMSMLYDYDSPLRASMPKDNWAELNGQIGALIGDMYYSGSTGVETQKTMAEAEAAVENIKRHFSNFDPDSLVGRTADRLKEYLDSIVADFKSNPAEFADAIQDEDTLMNQLDVVHQLSGGTP